MLAAEFGYIEPYVDRYLDIAKVNAHMAYRRHCPPVGALVKAILEGLSNEQSSEEEPLHHAKIKQDAATFVDEFASFGGVVKRRTKQGGEDHSEQRRIR